MQKNNSLFNFLPLQGKEATKKYGFTLVELIVVITILAILGTIAFISLQGYSANARDSKRISDVNTIKTSLELFQLDAGKYPLPDSGVEYSFSGELLWTQGTVGDNVIKNLSRNIQEKPLDPSINTEYIYSVINTQTQYEILANYELDNISKIDLQNGVYAANFTPKITGTYNGIYVKSLNYIVPSPSILNALNQTTDFNTNNLAIKSQVISGGENNIANGKILSSTGGLGDFSLYYTGTINNDSTDAEKISVIDTLQQAYSGTIFASNSEILYILSKTTDETKKSLADQIILNTGVVSTTSQNQDLPQDPDTPINYCTKINPSIVSYWKFDQEYNDNFTGIDGNIPNTELWQLNSNGEGHGSILINGNKVKFEYDMTGGTNTYYTNMFYNYTFDGDFSIEFSFSDLDTKSKQGAGIEIVYSDLNNNYRGFFKAGYSTKNIFNSNLKIDSINQSYNEVSRINNFGKIKIEKIGTRVDIYYKDGDSTRTFYESRTGIINNFTKISLGYWVPSLNGQSGLIDDFIINKGKTILDTKLTNTGTINFATWAPGKVGNALSFDGVDDYIDITDSSSLDITNQISISTWIKTNTVPPSENKYIVGKNRYSDNSRSYLLYLSTSGVIGFSLNPDGTVTSNKALGSASTLTSGIWNHIVGTYDGTKMKLYINGQYSSEKDYTGSIYSSSSPLRIASSSESTPTNFFNGLVDEVAIFNKGLSQEEVTKIYNDGIVGNNICGN